MIRCAIVFLFWCFTLCTLDIKIKWADGWSIELNGWPSALGRLFRRK